PASGISPHEKARLTLVIAIVLLALSGLGAAVAIGRLYLSEGWVRHTYTVEVALGDLESALAGVGRGRIAYVESPSPAGLQNFNQAVQDVFSTITRLRSLTNDNADEQSLCNLLQQNAQRRVSPSVASVALAQQNKTDPIQQMQLTSKVAASAIETAGIVEQMRNREDALLAVRNHLTKLLFGVTVAILIVSFTLSAVMFWIHNRLLQRELRDRETAENQLRKLSVQLLRVRDVEARRFARELHDGLGQSLVAAKMIADSILSENPGSQRFAELATLVGDATSQTRTISYLLHPPMLDDLGFASAADWFIEGFTQRTGIAVAARIAPVHLPKDLELALFRILQEALTNIHRHSKSAKAEVAIAAHFQEIVLTIKDYGMGIPPATLMNFKAKGTHVGVGLAGMKERVTEFNGALEIISNKTGTEIIVKMPLNAARQVSVESLA
ncbi:MAG: sensor histidine kinase, partial [Terracidiphilus sp.]